MELALAWPATSDPADGEQYESYPNAYVPARLSPEPPKTDLNGPIASKRFACLLLPGGMQF
jgi:hypothetical protein